jgi:hypothetical protein
MDAPVDWTLIAILFATVLNTLNILAIISQQRKLTNWLNTLTRAQITTSTLISHLSKMTTGRSVEEWAENEEHS